MALVKLTEIVTRSSVAIQRLIETSSSGSKDGFEDEGRHQTVDTITVTPEVPQDSSIGERARKDNLPLIVDTTTDEEFSTTVEDLCTLHSSRSANRWKQRPIVLFRFENLSNVECRKGGIHLNKNGSSERSSCSSKPSGVKKDDPKECRH